MPIHLNIETSLAFIFTLAMAPLLSAANEVRPLKRSADLDVIIEIRNNIWNITCIGKDVRLRKILEVYDQALPLLKTAQDFIDLFKNTGHLTPTADDFFNRHMDTFIAKIPSSWQIAEFDTILSEIAIRLVLKKKALRLVNNPSDFIQLVAVSPLASKKYREDIINFITENLSTFKEAKPSLNEINRLQAYLLIMAPDVNKIIDVLMELKMI